mmetsp:Transcript_68424/g.143015  ORF Transcript_68424/g.143015 Transcript_68424/m.143015 type:complete len:485 (-) Transcript_68424:128-1582(-)
MPVAVEARPVLTASPAEPTASLDLATTRSSKDPIEVAQPLLLSLGPSCFDWSCFPDFFQPLEGPRFSLVPTCCNLAYMRGILSGRSKEWEAPTPERHWARDAFNVSEIQIHENFDRFDADGSGYLDTEEMTHLLTDVQGGVAPSPEEIEWLIKVADRDNNGVISRPELLIAVQAWHGYSNLPDEFKRLFDEFDKDGDSYLDLSELQALLSQVTRHTVSKREAQDVMDVADILSDGKIGRYELHGALGAWYVSVGREPTPAMSLAFIANNRTGTFWQAVIDWAMIAMLAPCAYLALAAAFGAGAECKLNLRGCLIADGFLWGAYAVMLLMKGRWVQIMNKCLGVERACKAVYMMSWLTLGIEVFLLTALTFVEGFGFYYTNAEDGSGSSEMALCDANAVMPIDLPVSIRELAYRPYESFLAFCKMWFTFNLVFNGVTVMLYYAYCGWRFLRVWRVEKQLQDEAQALLEEDSEAESRPLEIPLRGA